MDICRRQRCLYEILILSWWWEDTRSTSSDTSDFNQGLVIICSEHVCWLQWVRASLGLEVSVCNISVIYWVVLLVLHRSVRMSYCCRCPLDITYLHYISCSIIFILFSHWSGSINIRNVLLVSNEFSLFRFQIGNAL